MKTWTSSFSAPVLALAVALAPACTDLPDIADGECGNLVLEPGEDCDGFSDPALGPGTQCAARGDANECRYVCDEATAVPCPEGWGCGTDGLCRRADGAVTRAPGSPWRFKVSDFEIGDVDGDGNADLIGAGDALISVRYGTETGEFPADVDVATRRPQGPPQFVDFDRDGLMDVVMPIFSGIFVMLGQADRTLLPVAYQPFAIDAGAIDIDQLDLLPIEALAGDLNTELLALVGNQQFFLVQAGDGDPLVFPNGHTVADILGRIPVAELDSPLVGNRADWAIAFSGESSVYVYTSTGLANAVRPMERQQVALPPGWRIRYGVWFGNVDGDTVWTIGSQDLLISATNGTRDAMFVAYNDGNGNLDLLATEEAAFEALKPSIKPLAVADLNHDLRADYVSGDGILLADFSLLPMTGTPPRVLYPTAVRTTELSWTDAATGDFNGDEQPDVVVSVSGQNGLDFYLGAGFLFNKFHVNTDDPPFALRPGDYDGDFVGDLAFGLSGLGGKQDGIAVSFGATSGGPVDPIFMGKFDFIRRLEPINSITDIEAIDTMGDLLVISKDYPDKQALEVAILQGNSDRRLLSPFSLTLRDEDGGGTDIPQRVLVGNFERLLPTDDPLDIAAVAQPPDNFGGADTGGIGPGTVDRTFRMWMVPGEGPDAALSVQDTSYAEMPAEADFETRCADWAAGDLDGDGLDEMIGVDGAWRCYGDGTSPQPRVVVASMGGGGPEVISYELPSEFTAAGSAKSVDLDADGDLDLLLLFRGEARGSATGDTGPVDGSGVLVVWNKDGALAFTSMSPLQIPDAFRVYDVAAMRLTGDDLIPELLVLADGAIYVATLDLDTYQYGTPELKIEQHGEAGHLRVGDVNGDGLDDVAWTEGPDVNVWLGVEAPPLGGAAGESLPRDDNQEEGQ